MLIDLTRFLSTQVKTLPSVIQSSELKLAAAAASSSIVPSITAASWFERSLFSLRFAGKGKNNLAGWCEYLKGEELQREASTSIDYSKRIIQDGCV